MAKESNPDFYKVLFGKKNEKKSQDTNDDI